MVNHLLHALAAELRGKACVRLEDVRKLHREILPNGLTSREEADLLISIDRAVTSADAAWDVFLVEAMVEFVVWTSRPTGYVDAETTDWLIASLGGDTGPAGAAMRIVFEIVREAEHVDEDLLVFALSSAQRRGRIAIDPAGLAGAA